MQNYHFNQQWCKILNRRTECKKEEKKKRKKENEKENHHFEISYDRFRVWNVVVAILFFKQAITFCHATLYTLKSHSLCRNSLPFLFLRCFLIFELCFIFMNHWFLFFLKKIYKCKIQSTLDSPILLNNIPVFVWMLGALTVSWKLMKEECVYTVYDLWLNIYLYLFIFYFYKSVL